jgi:hypothetical protein
VLIVTEAEMENETLKQEVSEMAQQGYSVKKIAARMTWTSERVEAVLAEIREDNRQAIVRTKARVQKLVITENGSATNPYTVSDGTITLGMFPSREAAEAYLERKKSWKPTEYKIDEEKAAKNWASAEAHLKGKK